MNSGDFHLGHDDVGQQDDFAKINELPENSGVLLSDRIQKRTYLDDGFKSPEAIDFNKVHKLKDIKKEIDHSQRASEISHSKKSGLNSSAAMSNQLKNFDDFDDEDSKSEGKENTKQQNENLDSEGDDQPKNIALDLSEKI